LAFESGLRKLTEAGLALHVGPTKKGLAAASVAQNVELFPSATITKRPGYRRWLHVREDYPVTGLVRIGDKYLIMAGDLDARDA
jgi:hypothetical protein